MGIIWISKISLFFFILPLGTFAFNISCLGQKQFEPMGIYQLKRTQLVNASPEAVWTFISSPMNLEKITPPSLNFRILNGPLPKKMYAGMMIVYKVSPFPGWDVKWVTEITHVEEEHYFVDEQRIGPYALWHHEHMIKEVQNGVEMTDIITYKLPFGFLGRWMHSLWVRKQLAAIFDFREQQLLTIFPVSA